MCAAGLVRLTGRLACGMCASVCSSHQRCQSCMLARHACACASHVLAARRHVSVCFARIGHVGMVGRPLCKFSNDGMGSVHACMGQTTHGSGPATWSPRAHVVGTWRRAMKWSMSWPCSRGPHACATCRARHLAAAVSCVSKSVPVFPPPSRSLSQEAVRMLSVTCSMMAFEG